ncbi:MAG: guanosine monophosphate reductase [Bdellovibrionaceae bacterium]|nr:guanosine monophosphate reductase [Pseudobdellovibrionaceae bacterium]
MDAFTFDDVLLVPAYNHYASRRDVDTTVTDRTEKLTLELPIISANMDTVTEAPMANFMSQHGAMGSLHRFMSVDKNVDEFKKCPAKTFVSCGISDSEMERVEALMNAGADYFMIDVAHAHARYVGHQMKRMRELIKDRCLAAGNVATYAGADYLSSCGADIIKVGIGGGSACTTRIKTGFGVPTLFSVKDCARVDRSIIADGGLRTPGDIVKALAFGADFVMLGGMLSGTRVTPGDVFTGDDGSRYKKYRGMASREANEDQYGAMPEWKTAEGVSFTVPYREDEENVIADIRGGLRSGLTYGGAVNVRELQRKLSYLVISPATQKESIAHGALKK